MNRCRGSTLLVVWSNGVIEVLSFAAALSDGQPPAAFRIFARGWNDTEKGRFLFDEKAARDVLESHARLGVDTMIDLEHASLDKLAPNWDPDARGWCRLEVRNGELWAVGVRWTEDGAARLSQKRQRYISPAFAFDPESRRVQSIWNVALVAQPATHSAEALVAASLSVTNSPAVTPAPTAEQWGQLLSALGLGPNNTMADVVARVVEQAKKLEPAAPAALSRTGGTGMDKKLVAQAMDVVATDAGKAAIDILKQILIAEAGGEPASDPEPDPGDPNEHAEQAAGEPAEMAADPKDPNAAPAEADPKKKDPAMAAASRLLRLTGKASFVEALSTAEGWRASHIEREQELAKLAAERVALEAGERRKLVAELVKLGAETPHTSGLATQTICKRLADEPLDELRARVVALSRRPSGAAPRTPTTATASRSFAVGGATVELSARELSFCAETGAKPEVYAANKMRMIAARRGGE